MPLSDRAASKLPTIRQPLDLPSTDGMTLEKVLQNQTASPFSLHDFADYLEQTYCAENLAFYMAVTDYQRSARLYFGSTPETLDKPVIISGRPFQFRDSEQDMLNHEERIRFDTLKAKFNDIIERFILTNAPQEVNIPYELRHQLLNTYHEHQSYHPAQLKPACVAVVELLRISAFIPFVTDPSRLQPAPARACAPAQLRDTNVIHV
ncbi:RGS domain-containing protein [Fennellomyces sp. T-0311]|nr:RGS domain-containing protein [Fennellomyces sp. T-0311]